MLPPFIFIKKDKPPKPRKYFLLDLIYLLNWKLIYVYSVYMSRGVKLFFVFVIFCFLLSQESVPALATRFSIVAPTGTLTRNQDVPFTINVNTEGATLTTAQTDVRLDINYLQYVGVTPGPLFTTVTGGSVTNDTVRLTGTVASGNPGVTGTGVFATMIGKIIADAPGEATLCTIVTPTTPTPVPTSPPGATAVPGQPTSPPVVTAAPVTTLPRSGTVENVLILGILGLALGSIGIGLGKINA